MITSRQHFFKTSNKRILLVHQYDFGFFFLPYTSIQLMYLAQYPVIRIFIFVTKKSKVDVKRLVTSCYIIEDTLRHIVLVSLVSTVNE